jgi:hypothetical protein
MSALLLFHAKLKPVFIAQKLVGDLHSCCCPIKTATTFIKILDFMTPNHEVTLGSNPLGLLEDLHHRVPKIRSIYCEKSDLYLIT